MDLQLQVGKQFRRLQNNNIHIRNAFIRKLFKRETKYKEKFYKDFYKREDGIKASRLKSSSRRNSLNSNPTAKEQQAVATTYKRGKQGGMSEQHSVHSNAIALRKSCTPKLMH